MSEPIKNELQNLRRPKISIDKDIILIADTPMGWYIFMAIFAACTLAYVLLSPETYNKPLGIIVTLCFFLCSAYAALNLKRIKIDVKQRVIYRRSLNPLENLTAYLLQHPFAIPFGNIEKIYADYVETGRTIWHYYVYIRTDDPYNLKIATFNKQADAVECATYLSGIIRR